MHGVALCLCLFRDVRSDRVQGVHAQGGQGGEPLEQRCRNRTLQRVAEQRCHRAASWQGAGAVEGQRLYRGGQLQVLEMATRQCQP